VRRFLEHWRPDLAILVESEVWPNLVLETHERGIPLLLANARMSKSSFQGWKRRPAMARALFGAFDLVLAQNEVLARRFSRLGAKRVQAVGNLKIDAPALPVDASGFASLKQALADRPVLLAASTHPGEEEAVAEACRLAAESCPGLLAIIVPRHPERGAEIARKLGEAGHRVALRSRGELPCPSHRIYIADTLGELGTFYRLSPLAFIGGSLIPHGGQNPIEAVKLGCICLTGPHWENFIDTFGALIRAGAVREVGSPEDLADAFSSLSGDEPKRRAMQAQAEKVLALMGGALDRTLVHIDTYLSAARRLDRAS
jgi:3-deoxy-D-manno-octulosonic-acid transferase